MFCTQCGTPHDDSANFCQKCGTPLNATVAEPQQVEPSRERRHNPQRQAIRSFPQSVEQADTLIHEKWKRQFKLCCGAAIGIGAIGLLILFCCIQPVLSVGGFLFMLFLLLGCLGVLSYGANRKIYLSFAEYHALEGAATSNGKTRCIHCGNVGLYTHGAYAETTKYHDCSRCSKTLYTTEP